ncbi:MAG: peroxiredoxin [Candidatus Korarchaeota archaeon]|nr:peroxiredoxin [Candidatus Korarchaeota archaeon]NIU84965.1 redoxin domain-containing protein [Candidatus Thorarchaeota archaeon]NIW14988.1 redoxin domain-containing protein [Candidatus Thorarchaeota archaeon]NIW52998.1 redoxin domain-containing protein [Candidatus Korarchaeota archaeon]
MIEVGEKAPDFKAEMYHPQKEEFNELSLQNLKGKWVIMAFHPGDFTFVCATDLEEFARKYEAFESENAEILAISTDTVFTHKMWVETSPRVKKVTYPMVGDVKKDISRKYGFLSEEGHARRGIVIVDPDGVVQYISIFNRRLGKDVNHIYRSFMGLKHIHKYPGTEEEFDIIPANWEPGKEAMHVKLPEDVGKF